MKTLVDVKARKRDLLAACAAMCGKDFAACTARAMLQQTFGIDHVTLQLEEAGDDHPGR